MHFIPVSQNPTPSTFYWLGAPNPLRPGPWSVVYKSKKSLGRKSRALRSFERVAIPSAGRGSEAGGMRAGALKPPPFPSTAGARGAEARGGGFGAPRAADGVPSGPRASLPGLEASAATGGERDAGLSYDSDMIVRAGRSKRARPRAGGPAGGRIDSDMTRI